MSISDSRLGTTEIVVFRRFMREFPPGFDSQYRMQDIAVNNKRVLKDFEAGCPQSPPRTNSSSFGGEQENLRVFGADCSNGIIQLTESNQLAAMDKISEGSLLERDNSPVETSLLEDSFFTFPDEGDCLEIAYDGNSCVGDGDRSEVRASMTEPTGPMIYSRICKM